MSDVLPRSGRAEPRLPRGHGHDRVVPRQRLYVRDDTILASTSLGPARCIPWPQRGESHQGRARGARAEGGQLDTAAGVLAQSTQLPHPYPDVARLARSITAGKTTTYAKVLALEAWIGAHTRYTTDIPPLLPGQDTVHQFLFVSRRGYCEQISTSLAVMLRTLGIPPARRLATCRGLQPHHRPLRRGSLRRPRLGPGLVPRLGMAELRPDAQVPLANPSPPTHSPTTHSVPSASSP